MNIKAVISNNKARYEYEFLEQETAGVMLMGSEIKPLTEGKAGLTEAFVWIDIENNAVWIKNMYIKNTNNNAYSHEEYRERKLLMTKKQVVKWSKLVETKGVTIIPIKGFFDNRNKYKIELALAKGKKLFDKRNTIKERDVNKDIQRELKMK